MRCLAVVIVLFSFCLAGASSAASVHYKSRTCVRVRAEIAKLKPEQKRMLRLMTDEQIAVAAGHTVDEVKKACRCVASR